MNNYDGIENEQSIIFKQSRFRKVALLLLAALLTASCTRFPEPPEDDESHATFAREVIPVVLGRKPYGVDEVELVADIAELHGRDVAVEMLMQDDRYIEHWADALVDILAIPRDNQGGVGRPQDSTCWSEPMLPAPDPSIAEWVRDHDPDDPGAPTGWNMADLLQSAIVLDDLSPLYRANLFPMFMVRGAPLNNEQDRIDVYRHLSKTYLNRDTACLKCHNPTFSYSNKTDGGGNMLWRRTWTIPGHPEKALFGDYTDAIATDTRVQYVFRGDVRATASAASPIQPWGMDDSCSQDGNFQRFTQALTTNYANAKFGSLDGAADPHVSLWELEQALHNGILGLQDGYGRFFSPGPQTPEETLYCDFRDNLAGCTGCHDGSHPATALNLGADDLGTELVNVATDASSSSLALRVVPNQTANSELFRRIDSPASGLMPPGGPANGPLITAATNWINGGAPSFSSAVCSAVSDVPDVDPDEGFAFLAASNLVDGIWMAMMGYRLTIDNGYSRTRAQRDALRNLTEYTFLPQDWSLSAVIKKVMSSEWMGRRAPDISQQPTAYELPMVLDPWIEADPSVVANPDPHEEANGQGEMVNNFRVNTILRNIATALDWEEPRRFPGGGYPSPLDQRLGQYISSGTPGFRGISFQSLLALEEEVGLCDKSGKSVSSDDWIDIMVSEVETYNTSNPDTPLTIGDVWKILKDRLIQDTTIETQLPVDLDGVPGAVSEAEALVEFINAGLGSSHTLSTTATELNSDQLEQKLREACGVLVKSPEFLLTNIAPRGYSDNNMPDGPPINVCLTNEPCGYAELCTSWRPSLAGIGHFTACEDRSIRSYTPIVFPRPWLDFERLRVREICPPSICGYIELPRAKPCLLRPELCKKLPEIPPVVPEWVDFKGLQPANMNRAGIVVMEARGAEVRVSENVMIRTLRENKWRPLKGGYRLETGDLIYLPYEASLQLNDRKAGSFGVKPLKPYKADGKPRYRGTLISVTGNDAVRIVEKRFVKEGQVPPRTLAKMDQAGMLETRGVTKKDRYRILKFQTRPEAREVPTLKQVFEMTEKEFDAQHVGVERDKFEAER